MRLFLSIIGLVTAFLVLPVSEARGQNASQDANQVDLSDTIFLASQGNMDAQFQVGRAYFTGKGIVLDKSAAVTFFKMAAEQGHTTSESLMGAFYFYGEGVEIDFEKSVKWYKRAAVKGSASAQLGLAGAYKEGLGISKNDIIAYAWHAISSAQGDKVAVELKGAFEEGMTQESIIAAQKLAILCLVSNYKECG